MVGNGDGKRHRWRISFRRSSPKPTSTPPPTEFVCPITKSLMFDPVIVTSGQTFERTALQLCKDLSFTPTSNPPLNFSTIIPNLNIRAAISTWCKSNHIKPPTPPDYYEVERVVKALIDEERLKEVKVCGESASESISERELLRGVAENPLVGFSHAATELNFRPPPAHFYSSSVESVVVTEESGGSSTPLPFATKPVCFFDSSSSSDLVAVDTPVAAETRNSDKEILSECGTEEDDILAKLLSIEVFEQEEGLKCLRKVTKSNEEARVLMCSQRLLNVLKKLIVSRYAVVQVNAVATLVNLSLEKGNKLKIVRSGIVPQLIDLLKGGSDEVQEHAAGAIFSLSLEEANKTAIGALGALQPLLHALRAESERTRCDAALALYHLSLIPTNRIKLVKLGAVSTLLTLLKGSNMTGRVILVLCNLAACAEGKSAMLDGNAVGIIVEMLREDLLDSESTQANFVAALYSLSYRSLRFRGMAKEVGAVEVLQMVEEKGSERAKGKARSILQMMRGSGDDGDNEEMGEGSGSLSRGMYRAGIGGGGGKNLSNVF